MTSLYPTLVSDRLVNTVNFYEDFFGFVPVIEKEGYVLLQKNDMFLAIFDAAHKCVGRLTETVQGLILSMPVQDVKAAYENLYMEGLEMYKEYGVDMHGKNHFVVYDPNGVLINVHEPLDIPGQIAA